MIRIWSAFVLGLALLLTGCRDETAPDTTPPAAPRGVYTVTGDHEVFIAWLENTESDVAGYRIYESPCATGHDCPYDPIGSTGGTRFTATGLTNGVTRYFAVSAYDRAGNESKLSLENLFDTPRPEGTGQALTNFVDAPATSGYDFSAFAVRPSNDPLTDIYFGARDTLRTIFTLFTDAEIQDAGYASTLDAVDFAPSGGWAPSGAVEAIEGHCYVVWLNRFSPDDHYAKFRVTSATVGRVVFDWAYQVAPGNRELKAHPAQRQRVPRPLPWRS